jgi:hypothetical protein
VLVSSAHNTFISGMGFVTVSFSTLRLFSYGRIDNAARAREAQRSTAAGESGGSAASARAGPAIDGRDRLFGGSRSAQRAARVSSLTWQSGSGSV